MFVLYGIFLTLLNMSYCGSVNVNWSFYENINVEKKESKPQSSGLKMEKHHAMLLNVPSTQKCNKAFVFYLRTNKLEELAGTKVRHVFNGAYL